MNVAWNRFGKIGYYVNYYYLIFFAIHTWSNMIKYKYDQIPIGQHMDWQSEQDFIIFAILFGSIEVPLTISSRTEVEIPHGDSPEPSRKQYTAQICDCSTFVLSTEASAQLDFNSWPQQAKTDMSGSNATTMREVIWDRCQRELGSQRYPYLVYSSETVTQQSFTKKDRPYKSVLDCISRSSWSTWHRVSWQM